MISRRIKRKKANITDTYTFWEPCYLTLVRYHYLRGSISITYVSLENNTRASLENIEVAWIADWKYLNHLLLWSEARIHSTSKRHLRRRSYKSILSYRQSLLVDDAATFCAFLELPAWIDYVAFHSAWVSMSFTWGSLFTGSKILFYILFWGSHILVFALGWYVCRPTWSCN